MATEIYDWHDLNRVRNDLSDDYILEESLDSNLRIFNEDATDSGDYLVADGGFGYSPPGYYMDNDFVHDSESFEEGESRDYTLREAGSGADLYLTIGDSPYTDPDGGFNPIPELDNYRGQEVMSSTLPEEFTITVWYTGEDFTVYDENGDLIHTFDLDLSGYGELYISIYEWGGGTGSDSLRLINTVSESGHANWEPIGDDGDPFEGTFDGGENIIENLYIDRPDEDTVGLFGYAHGATIENVGLKDVDVSGDERVGGLVGDTYDSEVSNSYSTGDVNGDSRVGGLVGESRDSSTVSNSYSTGTVSGEHNNVGGLVGRNRSSSTVSNSYSTGTVSGDNELGGLVGLNWDSEVSNSYSTGDVNGEGIGVGGLVGRVYNEEGETDEILYSYANSDITPDLDLIGSTIIGGTLDTTGSSLKTTAEMTDYPDYPDAYEGWDGL